MASQISTNLLVSYRSTSILLIVLEIIALDTPLTPLLVFNKLSYLKSWSMLKQLESIELYL